MGTASAALFADDTACDVRDQFVHLLSSGMTLAEATALLVNDWSDALADIDEGPVFWLALAATQWKYGCLDADVRSRALAVIDSGADLARWSGSTALKRRRSVLRELRKRLLSPQPRARRPQPRKPVQVASISVPSPDGRATATAFELGPSSVPGAPRMQVMVEMVVCKNRGGGGVFVADCHWDQVKLSWPDVDTLEIAYPPSAQVVDRKETTFYSGRTIKIRYTEVASLFAEGLRVR